MNLGDIVILLIFAVVIFQFWRMRAISEYAREFLAGYCKSRQLQLISVARVKTTLGMSRGKLDWKSTFVFEFSGNGEDAYQGTLDMIGTKVLDTTIPAYRV